MSIWDEPNPSGSPIEKLKIARRIPSPRDFTAYLLRQGVDQTLAQKIGRAVTQWRQEGHYDDLQSLIDLEQWANVHTHPGSGDGGGTPITYGTHVVSFSTNQFGSANDPGSEVHIYDMGLGTWTQKTSCPVNHRFSVGSKYNNKIYLIGCEGDPDTVYIYDPVTDSWSSGSSLRPVNYTWGSGIILGDFLYVYGGGQSGSLFTNRHDVYDILADTWSNLSAGPVSTRWQCASPAPGIVDGYFIFGGQNQGGFSALAAHYYDPGTDSWTAVAPIPGTASAWSGVSRNWAQFYDGLIYIGNQTEFFVFDPSDESYTALGTPPGIPTEQCAIMDSSNILAGTEVYSPSNSSWQSSLTYPSDRYVHQGFKYNLDVDL